MSETTERDPDTGRTPAEELLVRWGYYLGHAIQAVKREKAHDLLVKNGFDIAAELTSLKSALGSPRPSSAAVNLAEDVLAVQGLVAEPADIRQALIALTRVVNDIGVGCGPNIEFIRVIHRQCDEILDVLKAP